MQASNVRPALVTAGLLAAVLAWDLSGLDLPMAAAMGGAAGFPLRDHWLLTTVLHTGARYAAWLVTLALCLSITWPPTALRMLPTARRAQLAVSALLATAVITLLKAGSATSCPWDLQVFGGVARHVSHWAGFSGPDGGAGRCFPAGHAAAGFAFVGGWFALRRQQPGLARAWLAAATVAGVVLGVAQQLRGAHFMSHTLWTGWICWTTGWLLDPLFARAGVRLQAGAA